MLLEREQIVAEYDPAPPEPDPIQEEITQRIGYTPPPPETETESEREERHFRNALVRLRIFPYAEGRVERYKRRKLWGARLRSLEWLGRCVSSWMSALGFLWFILGTFVAAGTYSVAAGSYTGPLLISVLISLGLAICAQTYYEHTWEVQIGWYSYALRNYPRRITEEAKLAIRNLTREYPACATRFMIEELDDDPFLYVLSPLNRRYYIEVWDETSFIEELDHEIMS